MIGAIERIRARYLVSCKAGPSYSSHAGFLQMKRNLRVDRRQSLTKHCKYRVVGLLIRGSDQFFRILVPRLHFACAPHRQNLTRAGQYGGHQNVGDLRQFVHVR